VARISKTPRQVMKRSHIIKERPVILGVGWVVLCVPGVTYITSAVHDAELGAN
jgi:hypothetical protein